MLAPINHGKGQRRGGRLRGEGGWSLMEVMVATSMILILAGIAVPQYSQIARQMRASAAASELLGNLAYARAQSIRTGVRHYVSTSEEEGVFYRVQRVGASNMIVPEEDPVLRRCRVLNSISMVRKPVLMEMWLRTRLRRLPSCFLRAVCPWRQVRIMCAPPRGRLPTRSR